MSDANSIRFDYSSTTGILNGSRGRFARETRAAIAHDSRERRAALRAIAEIARFDGAWHCQQITPYAVDGILNHLNPSKPGMFGPREARMV